MIDFKEDEKLSVLNHSTLQLHNLFVFDLVKHYNQYDHLFLIKNHLNNDEY